MRLGFYLSPLVNAPGFEHVISAHIQLPCKLAQFLQASGVNVEIITTRFHPSHTLPSCLPEGITVHQVTDHKARGDSVPMYSGHSKWVSPIALLRLVKEIKEIVYSRRLDVLHLFGSDRIFWLLILLRFFRINCPIFVTLTSITTSKIRLLPKLAGRCATKIIISTEFCFRALGSLSSKSIILRHGIDRQLCSIRSEPGMLYRVLYWRDPSYENGADICATVFKNLAPKYPTVSFDVAVRPHPNPVQELINLDGAYPNLRVYTYPYPSGVTLESLTEESICIFLPFRHLSAQPQYAVIESMKAGKAIVTSNVESNNELVHHRYNGLVSEDGSVDSYTFLIETLLNDVRLAIHLGKQAKNDIERDWSWQKYVKRLHSVYKSAI